MREEQQAAVDGQVIMHRCEAAAGFVCAHHALAYVVKSPLKGGCMHGAASRPVPWPSVAACACTYVWCHGHKVTVQLAASIQPLGKQKARL
jgi:hypothetical protein